MDTLNNNVMTRKLVVDNDISNIFANAPRNTAANSRLLFVEFAHCGECFGVLNSGENGDGGDCSDGGCGEDCHIVVFGSLLLNTPHSNAALPIVKSENEKNEIIFSGWVMC